MTEISFKVSKDDADLIGKIVERAYTVAGSLRAQAPDRLTLTMDLTATHANGSPLKLAELLNADCTDFIHDVWGIMHHIDRETGQLGNCFLPRFSA